MANPNKRKGDAAEREAVVALLELAPDLAVWNAQRMLGAGRKEDVGDLLVFPDVTIQVKAAKPENLSRAIYQAADGAKVQAARARKPFALGLVQVPRARKVGAVRWMAVVHDWPGAREVNATHSAGITAFKAIQAAGPDEWFLARVERKGQPTIHLGSLQTWVADYRTVTSAVPA